MIGQTVSHYNILEKLGEGGMGVVYKAEDTKLKRIVALKFLPESLSRDPDAKERFLHEAQAAAALEHQHICNIYEIDEADHQTFIVMSCFDGRTIKEKIDAGPLTIDETLKIAVQAADGLHAAHEKGIIHRDIKSANIMVTEKGETKIMDFGLAKLKGQTTITQEGSTLGTPAYMSPEQARGAEVDHRTDIWSLGVVLYEMITGRTPFKGEYHQAVIYSIMNEAPEPPTALRTGVPMELERIVNKALAKDPAERYQHADDLLVDLNKLKKDSASGMSVYEETVVIDKPKTALKPRFIAAALILLVLFAGYWFLSKRQPAPPAGETGGGPNTAQRKKIVVFPFENLGPPEDKYFAAGVTDEITSRLAAVSRLGVISRTSAVQYDRKGKTMKQIGEDLGVHYVLEGTIRWDRAAGGDNHHRVRVTPQLIRVADDTNLWSQRYDRVIQDIFEVQAGIADHVIQHLDITLPASERRTLEERPTKNLEAYNAYLRGASYLKQPGYEQENFQMADRMFQRAVQLDPDFARAYCFHSLVHSLTYLLGYDRTEERRNKAKSAVDRAFEIQPGMPLAHMSLGYYYFLCFNAYDRAHEEFRIAKKGLPNEIMVLEALFRIQMNRGKLDDAIEDLKNAVDLDPRNSNYHFELALCYAVSRRYAHAEKHLDRSISLAPDQISSYGMKAINYYLWGGDLPKARAALEQMPRQSDPAAVMFWCVQELHEKNYPASLDRLNAYSADVIKSVDTYLPKSQMAAYIYFGLKRPGPALKSMDAARVSLEEEVKQRPGDARIHASLGMAYAILGRKEAAIKEGKHAVELQPVSRDAIRGPSYVKNLAQIYTITGEHHLAVETLEYLLSIPSFVSVPLLKMESSWDALRQNPKFQQLLQKYAPGKGEEVER